MKKILVWDLPVRVMHWLLAVLVLGAFALANLASDESVVFALHAIAGLIALFVVALRSVWGLVGTRWARFRAWPLRPSALVRYLRGVFSDRASEAGVGHNPATSWFALAVFVGIAGLGVTGFLAARGNEAAEEVHELLAWSVIGLVALHVAGVLLHVARRRENLVATMITGRRAGAEVAGIPSARAGVASVFLVLAVVFGALLLSGLDVRQRRLTLPLIGTPLALGESEREDASKRSTSGDAGAASTSDETRADDHDDDDEDDD
jgi:cytochrome b